MYDRTSSCNSVDDARCELLTQKGRSIEFIPPTAAALLQHAKRAVYQVAYVWGQSLLKAPVLPVRLIGDGQRTIQPHGSPCGQRCPKLAKHVKNSLSNVVARATEVVVVGANV